MDWTTGLDYWIGLLDWTTGLTETVPLAGNIQRFDSALQERRGYLASLPGLLHIVSQARFARESLARETIL